MFVIFIACYDLAMYPLQAKEKAAAAASGDNAKGREPEELDFMFDEELERLGGGKKKIFAEL